VQMTTSPETRLPNVNEACGPRVVCCGLPLVWADLTRDGIWDAKCLWCGREFSYSDPKPD